MTETESSTPPKKRGVGTAIFFGLIWFTLLAGVWYLTEERGLGGEGEATTWMIFLGRFHALIVHLPIGLILAVPILELLGRKDSWASFREAVPAVLWLVFFGALGSSFFGYLLMQGELIESRLMTLHLWTGLAVGGAALLTLVFKLLRWGPLYAICLIASLGLIASAGHFGGAMVHGKEYLAAHAPEILKPVLMAGLEEKTEEAEAIAAAPEETPAVAEDIVLEDRVVFTEFVLPVLDAKCNECHNEEKTKGKLRMDTHELLLAGVEGADYPNVAPGDSDESEMIYRVTLESDDDDFMPPDGKEPLTPEEIKLIRWWIDGGASAEVTIAETEADEEMIGLMLAVEASLAGNEEAEALAEAGPISEWDLLGPEERIERLDAAMALAEQYNFSLMPISAEDDRLRINVVNAAKDFGDEQLAALAPIAERIVWLDLARSRVTDEGLKSVGRMRNLERLHLENTAVTDTGLAELGRLTKVEYLNLYGTAVTAGIFDTLQNMRDLKKLYLWQTRVEPKAASAFQRSMSLEVNIGYELAATENEEPAAPTETSEEKKPVAESKPVPKPNSQPDRKDQQAQPDAKPGARKAKPAGS